jgi:hypothetical protein
LTSTQILARRDRWLRAVWSGFLAEFSTVLTVILIAEAYYHLFAPSPSDPGNAAIGERIGGIVGIVAGTLFTYLFARLLMLVLTRRFVEHGLVVALTAIAFSVGGSIVGHHGVPLLYVLASILKLGAGALAGFLAAKQYAPVVDAGNQSVIVSDTGLSR